MKANVYHNYGQPDVLRLEEVEKPTPRDNEVLIRIRATTVANTDITARQGVPFFGRFYTGPVRPKKTMKILGAEFAGQIEAVARDGRRLREGDQVFGATAPALRTNAEYICLSEQAAVVIKPANLTHEEAAAVPAGSLTALPFLRDKAEIQSGHDILINGASGSVGTYAVQLAKYFGARVTGVCGTTSLEVVRSLGTDEVVDYTKSDFTQNGQTYDIVFDTVGKSSFSLCKDSLKHKGVYLTTVPTLTILLQALWTSKIGNKKAMIAFTGLRPPSEKAKDLLFLGELIEAGRMKPVIDRCYPLEQTAEAHRYVDKGHKKGNVVITV